MSTLPTKAKVVIIGGGYIGLETAASLSKLDASVTVLEREERVLSRVTAPEMSTYFKELHHQHGVSVLSNKNVTAVDFNNGINEVQCDDNSSYKVDIIIVGVGIKVNTELDVSSTIFGRSDLSINRISLLEVMH